jgi:hypothetical protein
LFSPQIFSKSLSHSQNKEIKLKEERRRKENILKKERRRKEKVLKKREKRAPKLSHEKGMNIFR